MLGPILPVPLSFLASQMLTFFFFPDTFVCVRTYLPLQKHLGYAKSIPCHSPCLNKEIIKTETDCTESFLGNAERSFLFPEPDSSKVP